MCISSTIAMNQSSSLFLKASNSPFKSRCDMQFLVTPSKRHDYLDLHSVHRDIPVDIAAAIDEFAKRHPRRTEMLDIMNE